MRQVKEEKLLTYKYMSFYYATNSRISKVENRDHANKKTFILLKEIFAVVVRVCLSAMVSEI